MIIMNIGLPSSASTWVSNVVYGILAHRAAVPVMRFFANSLASVPLPRGRADLVLKSHDPMSDLILLARTGAAKLIVTVRDPRDCVTSIMQRYGRPFERVVQGIVESMAHIDALPLDDALLLRYEDRYFERPETILRLAEFLGVGEVGEDFAASLLARFSAEEVRRLVAAIPDMPEDDIEQSVDSIVHKETGFHTNHVTDGRSGKFIQHLTPARVAAIETIVAPIAKRFGYAMEQSVLPVELFACSSLATAGDPIVMGPGSGCAVFGPYINLAAGRWTARFLTERDCPVDIAAAETQLARGSSRAPLEFTVENPAAFVEFRTYAKSEPNAFAGVALRWLGS